MPKTLRYGSLFSGIGGIDLGLDRAGMQATWQVEIDAHCRRVLAKHWPDVPRHADITTVHGAGAYHAGAQRRGADRDASGFDLEEQSPDLDSHEHAARCDRCLPPVDLVCGGFPCQDLSMAGRRAGLAGGYSGLWYEMLRIIAGLLPQWVLVENVPGLLSAENGASFGNVTSGLVKLGYGVAWRVLNAQYFGVPQRRRRVFIVGHFGEPWSAPGAVLFEPEGGEGDTAAGNSPRENIANSIRSSSGSRGTDDHDRMTYVAAALSAPQHGQHYDAETETYVPMATQRDAGGLGVSMAVRRLTPRLCECERLQGFPDGFTFGSDSARYRMLGNAVAVPVASWLAQRLMHHHGEEHR